VFAEGTRRAGIGADALFSRQGRRQNQGRLIDFSIFETALVYVLRVLADLEMVGAMRGFPGFSRFGIYGCTPNPVCEANGW
jgi:hypothetical protein